LRYCITLGLMMHHLCGIVSPLFDILLPLF
jgi:hypothetical protein